LVSRDLAGFCCLLRITSAMNKTVLPYKKMISKLMDERTFVSAKAILDQPPARQPLNMGG
jgi:hypothetical protein